MQTIAGYAQCAVEARGLRFNVLEWGEAGAPPMVLLHGLTGHAHTWDHMAPALAARYHVFVPDQRGHGDTSAAESYATADFVDDLQALVREWDIDRFVLVGLSMGGHNAIAYAAAHPEHVARLVIIDIPPKMSRQQAPNWDVISKLAETGHTPFATFDEAVESARAGNPTAPEENLRYRTHHNLRFHPGGSMTWKYDPAAPARWDPADLTGALPRLSMPALLVRGGLTQVLPASVAASMLAAMPDAELLEIADSGHSVPTDRPEKLAPLLLDWLDRHA